MGSFPTDPHLARERTKLSRGNISYRGTIKVPAYREELELERLLWRRRPGDRDLLRTGDLRLGERDLQEEKPSQLKAKAPSSTAVGQTDLF